MDGCQIERWDTPFSNATSVSMLSLVHDGSLTISIDADGARFRIVFRRGVFGYKNLLEEYRLSLWSAMSGAKREGWTWRMTDSPWIRELRDNEPLFMPHGGDQAVHYVICTEDDVIDVIAKEPPEVEAM